MARFTEIKDINDEALDVYVRLTGAQLRRRLEPCKGIFIAESPTVIEVALNANIRPISLLTDARLLDSKQVRDIIKKCTDVFGEDFPVYYADRELLRDLTGFELTRGALCAMWRPQPTDVGELLSGARRVAVLESVTDSTNVGAIFRSAAALGIDAVLVSPTCCDPLCRRAVRVSMGTVFQVPFGRIGVTAEDWPRRGMEIISELGFKCAAMALSDNSVSIDDKELMSEERLAIILGTEGTGLSPETIALSDYTVRIPMSNGVDSLNVGAAAAVAFWQLTR